MSLKNRWILTGLLALALAATAGFAVLFSLQLYREPGPLSQQTLIDIPAGASARRIGDLLLENGAIGPGGKYLMLAAVRLDGKKLQAGEYEIQAAASIRDILNQIANGRVYQRKITVPEGLTSRAIADLLNADPSFAGEPVTAVPAEGALMPETYNYTRSETRQAVLDRMQKAMTDETARIWQDRAADLPFKTPQEMVVFASIVEKETGLAAERPRVAGVFINRLRLGMPLQSDPTVIYALTLGKKELGRALLSKDLKTPSPYNTYMNKDLPPGPIANPGRASLEAAANPERHDWLYFVADGSGGHAFAKTLKEHNKNVTDWRKISR